MQYIYTSDLHNSFRCITVYLGTSLLYHNTFLSTVWSTLNKKKKILTYINLYAITFCQYSRMIVKNKKNIVKIK